MKIICHKNVPNIRTFLSEYTHICVSYEWLGRRSITLIVSFLEEISETLKKMKIIFVCQVSHCITILQDQYLFLPSIKKGSKH